jgi:lipid-binding SYLF domain-containing protein
LARHTVEENIAGGIAMQMLSRVTSRLTLKAGFLVALALMFTAPSQAQMACQINLEFTKGGFVIGGSGGSGTLTCNGQNYPLKIGGLSAGLVIGISKVNLVGEVRNLYEIPDIEGAYSGVGASMAIGGGADNLVAANAKGVQLVLRGTQVGLEASLDLSGMKISLR